MSENHQDAPRSSERAPAATSAKRPWHKPVLKRMKAGSAEVGTRAANDGSFTTS